MWLAVWIVCRTSILDSKTPATGCNGHAMHFLAVRHKNRISFLRNSEQIQKNSYKIQKNLDLIEEIKIKFRGNSEEIQRKFRENSEEIQIFLEKT
jgi:hypothetical protein